MGQIGVVWFVTVILLLSKTANSFTIKCDEGWVGFSESPSCYKFTSTQDETFEDARQVCRNYDADLVNIDSKAEKDFIATTMGELANKINWWVGLSYNNESSPNQWEWSDGSTLDENIVQWATNMPNNKGCGAMKPNGKLMSSKCEATRLYACEKSLGAPVKCGEDWERYGGSCYQRHHHDEKSWDEARQVCLDSESDLLIINSVVENLYIYEFAKRDNVDVWLGIRENATDNKFYWVDGTENGGQGVLKVWEPDQPLPEDGNKAGFMVSSSHGAWSTKTFDEKLAFVCEKQQGDFCQFDLVNHANRCYDFYTDLENVHDWVTSRKICYDVGMSLLEVNNKDEDNWVTEYLYALGFFNGMDGGPINGIWIDFQETSKTSEVFRRLSDNKTIGDEGVYNAMEEIMIFNPDRKDCLFSVVCPKGAEDCNFGADPDKRWQNDDCEGDSMGHMTGCEMKKGDSLNIEGLMHPKQYCPEGWPEPFAGHCYLAVATEESWGGAKSFCKDNQSTSDLVSILSVYENDYVNNLAKELGPYVWMGFDDQFTEGTWTWSDGSPSNYDNWNDNEPNGGASENCGEIRNGGWNDALCSVKNPFICKMVASTDPSGNPVLPDTSTMPPTTNCGYSGKDWVENTDTGMCYHLITKPLTWHDAKEHCRILGGYREHGNLASIGSHDEQLFINSWLTLTGHFASTWVGMSDFNLETAFEWSDGTPFAFINWRDNEPNGGDSENCVEINENSKGAWNDYTCTGALSAICEKQGSNYQPPPDPTPPPVTCPLGWSQSLGRCIYNSWLNDEFAYNWTEANSKCSTLLPGASLASIHNQAEQDEILSMLYDISFLGGNDAYEEGTWVWADGTPWTFDNWGGSEPNGNTSENCLEIDAYGMWNDIPCAQNIKKPFFCSSDLTVCPENWQLYDSDCWYFSGQTDATSWDSARDVCKTGGDKADLITIHDGHVNDYLAANTPDNGWIGLTIASTEWVDGSTFDYNNWAENEPNNQDTENCGSVDSQGQWYSNNCEESKSFTCKFKASHYLSCPLGWQKWNGNCYLLQSDSKDMSFQRAEGKCVDHGGHLASILSSEEMSFVQSMIADYNKCGDYWTEDAELKSCYYYSAQKATWPEARQICLDEGSDLVVIQSKQKNDRLLAMIAMGTSFWAGANDSAVEGSWVWVDGSSMDYNDWNPNEPNGGTDENCLEVYHNDGYWAAGTWNDFFCEDGSTNFFCEKPMSEDGRTDLWIGLNDLDQSMTLEWTDGNRVSYTNWAEQQPYHHMGDEYMCAKLTTTNQMAMVPCDTWLPFLCKQPEIVTNIPPDVFGCEEGQVAFEGSCYEIHYDRATFASAQSHCIENGGNLLAISNENEQAKITSIVAENEGKFFIGLSYNEQTLTYEWISGEYVFYTNWDRYQPDENFDDGGSGKCVSVRTVGTSTGFWYVTSCGEPRGYICELPRKGYTNPPTTVTTVQPEAKCPTTEWEKYNDHCYKYFDVPRSFSAAREYCAVKGGDLATFFDSNEELYATTYLGVEAFIWIGLRQSENSDEGGYTWVDGTGLDYDNFKDGQPNSNGNQDNCILLDYYISYVNGWENHNCESELGFLCEVVAGTEPPNSVEPPTDSPDVPCKEGQDDGWIQMPDNADFCYQIVSNQNLYWQQAEMYCEKKGARLASIHTNDENNFVMTKLAREYVQNAWLGLNDLDGDGSYDTWVDGTPTEYLKWGKGEPNDWSAMESCVLMYSSSGYWNDAHCAEAANGFVCKKPREGGWTTPKPTPLPEGHCPQDHYEFKGYCYKFQGLDSGGLNWTMALDSCRAMGNNYHLASVHSDNEMAYLVTKFAEGDSDAYDIYEFWIGLHDWVHDYTGSPDRFYWSDETQVEYVNWAPGEPNNYDYDWDGTGGEDCVEAYARNTRIGKWNDLTCEAELPYICKTRASPDNHEAPPVKMCSDEAHNTFLDFLGDCYLWVQGDAKTWQDAESDCLAQGGSHLVSITDVVEQAFVLNNVQTEMSWIGLSDKRHHGYYMWSDQWPMLYSNWGSNPPVDNEEDVCVAYNSTDGKWYPRPCNENYNYLCKYSTEVPPTPSPNGVCPSQDFKDLDTSFDYCYYFTTDETVFWNDAEKNCQALGFGAHLVSIHSEEEMNKILQEIKPGGVTVWIGLYTTPNSDGSVYYWVDGSPYNFNFWEEGEPNGPGVELCVQAYSTNGKWNDAQCQDSYGQGIGGYVCSVKKVHYETSPLPPTRTTSAGGQTTITKTTKTSSTQTTSTTTASSTTTSYNITAKPKGNGLSSGAIAGIVIVSLILVAGTAVFVIMWQKRESQLRKLFGYNRGVVQQQSEQQTSGFENIAYDPSSSRA